MADLFEAYKFLNEALGLNLTDVQIARAEAGFRLTFTDREKYKIAKKDIHNWEFFSHLAPRKTKTRPDLAAEARRRPLKLKSAPKKGASKKG